ncbi:MAG: hypothetical protein GC155_03905 [Alphaproteobacteria bacterium]|nr:hypothetical protein [Alphaproteobacteria bacterium]
MFHEFFRWLQEDLGRTDTADSWSLQFHGSLNLWGLTEGTHVMTLVLFAGTIFLVDLRLLGVAFKSVPFSKLNDKILPLTVAGFIIMIVTGVILFLAKPLDYYHSVWFRTKMIFLVIASLNIFWFHFKVQKNQEEWDTAENPPRAARISAAISITSWTIIILCGRFIAYNWFDCDKLGAYVQGYAERHQAIGETFFKGLYSYGECASMMKVPDAVQAAQDAAPAAEPSPPPDTPPAEGTPAEPTPAETQGEGN